MAYVQEECPVCLGTKQKVCPDCAGKKICLWCRGRGRQTTMIQRVMEQEETTSI